MDNIPELLDSLRTGFVDKEFYSTKEFLPRLLVNNKSAGKKVLTSLVSELNNCDEFLISVAFVTASGVAVLLQTLMDLE